jgi:hypothetical protein
MATVRFQSGFACTGECGCFTERLVDDPDRAGRQIALCVWCEDGEDCPNKPQPAPTLVPDQPKRRRGKTAAQADLQTTARLAHLERRQQLTETRPHTMMPTVPCKHCGTPTRSKVGYCAKHFYMSKLKGAPGVKAKPARKPKATAARELLEARKTATPASNGANGHGTNGHGSLKIPLTITEDELNGFILRLPLQQKIRMVEFFIKPTSAGSEIGA